MKYFLSLEWSSDTVIDIYIYLYKILLLENKLSLLSLADQLVICFDLWVVVFLFLFFTSDVRGWNESVIAILSVSESKLLKFLYNIFFVPSCQHMTFSVYECVSIYVSMWSCVY